jgi:pyruvate,orthophosphate dikinase
MILADSEDARREALGHLLPFQRDDFEGLFRAMDGKPVTIRLLDPPLHEFLPSEDVEVEALAEATGRTPDSIRDTIESLEEFNPMLGHRGCRLGTSYPEITEMQARAILEAAVRVQQEGVDVHPEIMVPLISTRAELEHQKQLIDNTAAAVFDEQDASVDYLVGTMIEVPRAALTAGDIAEVADFFSFGTNDLTQMTFGFSRDDAGSFLPRYVEDGLLEDDPFRALDQTGVGQLVRRATTDGRGARPGLKVGICGEHGGEPASVAFCLDAGLDYVSCSPFRVPIARLAAAQAALEQGKAAEGAPAGDGAAA